MDPSRLRIPNEQRYECRLCTRCCRGWVITVSPDAAPFLLATDWGRCAPRLAGVTLFDQSARQVAIRKGDDQACLFLEADGRCVIHREFGGEAKSVTCRRFPFSFIHTPLGTRLYVSFACPAVVGNRGAPVGDRRAELAALADRAAEHSATLPERVPVTGGATVDWPAFERFEAALLSVLERPGQPRRLRLIAGYRYIEAFIAAVEAGGPADGLPPAPDDDRLFAAAAALPADSALQQRVILAAFIGPSEQFYARAIRRWLATSFRIVFSIGRVRLNSLATELPAAAIHRVTARRFDDGELEPLDRFIRHFVQRGSLAYPLPLRNSCRFFLLSLGLVKWYARASAAAAGRGEAAPGDFTAALEIVERFYLSHRAFYAAMLGTAPAAFFVNHLLTDWRFPATILREP